MVPLWLWAVRCPWNHGLRVLCLHWNQHFLSVVNGHLPAITAHSFGQTWQKSQPSLLSHTKALGPYGLVPKAIQEHRSYHFHLTNEKKEAEQTKGQPLLLVTHLGRGRVRIRPTEQSKERERKLTSSGVHKHSPEGESLIMREKPERQDCRSFSIWALTKLGWGGMGPCWCQLQK